MLKALELFCPKKSSRKFKDYYAEWFNTLKNSLLPLLRRSISGSSPTLLSTHVEMLHQHFQSYYHALDLAASSDVSQLLFPEWRNSLEKPFLWLGDLHPYLFTNLLRSYLDDDCDDEDDNNNGFEEMGIVELGESFDLLDKPWQIAMAWKNPSSSLLARVEQIECGVRLMVPSLATRMRNAQMGFVDWVGEEWFRCRRRKEAAKLRVAEAMKDNATELVSIYLDANRLRRSVLSEIVSATGVYQAALFLEGLAEFLVGFGDYDLLCLFSRCNTSLDEINDQ